MTVDQHIRRLITGTTYQGDLRVDVKVSQAAEAIVTIAIDGMVDELITPDQALACSTRGELFDLVRELPELQFGAAAAELERLPADQRQAWRHQVDAAVLLFDQQVQELERELSEPA